MSLPNGFRRGHDDSLACPHRDLSCCNTCHAAHPEIVEVVGRHYWIADETERNVLRELARHHRNRDRQEDPAS